MSQVVRCSIATRSKAKFATNDITKFSSFTKDNLFMTATLVSVIKTFSDSEVWIMHYVAELLIFKYVSK